MQVSYAIWLCGASVIQLINARNMKPVWVIPSINTQFQAQPVACFCADSYPGSVTLHICFSPRGMHSVLHSQLQSCLCSEALLQMYLQIDS